MAEPPRLIVETRGGHTEAVHHGHAVVVDATGRIRGALGDPTISTFWRSSVKPLQAHPFVAGGACDAFGLGVDAIAIACASHSSEPMHTAAVRTVLDAAGVPTSALQCGHHTPLSHHAGPTPSGGWTPLHNNCSGKHAAMLATCVHEGWPIGDYIDADHPLQVRIRETVMRAAQLDASSLHWAVDGCGVPTFHAPLVGLARGVAWLQNDDAGRRILEAMATRPALIAGTGRPCTDLAQATGGDIVGKTGAQGVYVAIRRTTGDTFALKVEDGSRPAVEAAAIHLAQELGWLDAKAQEVLAPHRSPVVTNHVGVEVGRVVPDFERPKLT